MTLFRRAEARLSPNQIRFDAVVAYDGIIGNHAPGITNVGALEVRLVPGLRAKVHGAGMDAVVKLSMCWKLGLDLPTPHRPALLRQLQSRRYGVTASRSEYAAY